MPLIDGLHGSEKCMEWLVVDVTSNAPRRSIQHLELLTNTVAAQERFEALRFTRMLTRDLYIHRQGLPCSYNCLCCPLHPLHLKAAHSLAMSTQ